MPITMLKGTTEKDIQTMGMAASQARLLTITARMHDIEYQAQSIQNAKIALATQSDQVYQEYVAALDEQTLTVKDWRGNTIAANFNNLCGINAVDSSYKYALKDSKGRLIVDRNIAEQYQKFMKTTDHRGDAYAFAYYMMNYSENGTEEEIKEVDKKYNDILKKRQENVNIIYKYTTARAALAEFIDTHHITDVSINSINEQIDGTKSDEVDEETEKTEGETTETEGIKAEDLKEEKDIEEFKKRKDAYEEAYRAFLGITSGASDSTAADADLRQLWNIILSQAESGGIDTSSGLYLKGKDEEFDALVEKYLYLVNKRHSEDIYAEIYGDRNNETGEVINAESVKEYYDDNDFNYYVTIFKQIQANGGSCVSIANCVDITSYDGFDGDAASDGDWLRDMIQSGKITIDHVNTDPKNGRVTFSSTSVPSDSVLEYTATSSIDSAKVAKIQAEYEHKTKELDRKDKKFDMDLSKLDTQRTALKTEYESVKKVISENIDRTFGIFS